MSQKHPWKPGPSLPQSSIQTHTGCVALITHVGCSPTGLIIFLLPLCSQPVYVYGVHFEDTLSPFLTLSPPLSLATVHTAHIARTHGTSQICCTGAHAAQDVPQHADLIARALKVDTKMGLINVTGLRDSVGLRKPPFSICCPPGNLSAHSVT